MGGALTRMLGGSGGSVVNGTTFSSNFHRPSATLSNGNLTLSTTTTGYQSACSIDAKASGDWYFEVTIGVGFSTSTMEIGVGVVDWRQPINSFAGDVAGAPGGQVGQGAANNATYRSSGGRNTVSNPLPTWAAGDIISIHFDATNGTFRARHNGGTWTSAYNINDSSGNPKFPFVYVSGNGCSITANFGSSAFAYTPPSGASGWTKNGSYAGRYWRYYIRESIYNGVSNPNINIRETELRLTSGGADQTGSGTASASSNAGASFTADKAVDNSTSTQWVCANNAGVNSNWQYDFGSGNSPAIKEISWQIRSDLTFINYPARFQVLFSSDGTVFYPAGHHEPTYTTQGETQSFACADG